MFCLQIDIKLNSYLMICQSTSICNPFYLEFDESDVDVIAPHFLLTEILDPT